MPRTTNRGINPHTHEIDDIVGIEDLSGVETFTFSPGRTFDGQPSKGNYYNDWPTLYSTYSSSVEVEPGKNRAIAFDPHGLPAGTPITIPVVPGVAVQTFESQTVFTSAGNPTNPVDVATAAAVEFQISPDLADPTVPAILTLRGINLYQDAAAPAPLVTVPAGRKFKLSISDGKTVSRAPSGLFHVLDGDLEVTLLDADMAQESSHLVRMSGAGRTYTLRSRGVSTPGRDTVRSDFDLGDVRSEISPQSRPAPQKDLSLPDGRPLYAPAANSNKRPAFPLTILARGQLNLVGATSVPQILQAWPLKISINPAPGETLVLTNGVVSEIYTFVAVFANPFDVVIGGSVSATMSNLATAITAFSALWKSETITIPGGGGRAVAIIRKTQTKEGNTFGLIDRAFGDITASIGSYAEAANGDAVPLSYSMPTFSALPAADPAVSFAGWSSVDLLPDSSPVSVIDGDASGTYVAENPFGAGSGSWSYVSDGIDAPLTIPAGGGAYSAERQTRLVVATLGAADVLSVALPDTFQPGEILSVFRTDATAGTMALVPGISVNGAAGPFAVTGLAGGHGLMLQHGGGGVWVVVGQFP